MRKVPDDPKSPRPAPIHMPFKLLLMALTAVVVIFVFWSVFGHLLPGGWESNLFRLVVIGVVIRYGLLHVHREKIFDHDVHYSGVVSKRHDYSSRRHLVELVEAGVTLQVRSRDWHSIDDRQSYDITYGGHTKRLIFFTKHPDKRLR